MLSGTLATNMPNVVQGHPTNQRYPLDTYHSKYQEYHGTPRDQDQDIWQDQEVLTRS